jgi:NADH-quinone oxidoreductase subunit J
MNWSVLLFWILALSTGMAALAVVFSTNIVRTALWLFMTLLGVAMVYFFLGFEFLGAAQLIIYVGGILVLFVFGVMLTAQSPADRLRSRWIELILGSFVGLAFLGILGKSLLRFGESKSQPNVESVSVQQLGLGFLNAVTPEELPGLHKGHPGSTLGGFLFPFEILSVHLLVVLIGAAYLARAKRKFPSEEGKS